MPCRACVAYTLGPNTALLPLVLVGGICSCWRVSNVPARGCQLRAGMPCSRTCRGFHWPCLRATRHAELLCLTHRRCRARENASEQRFIDRLTLQPPQERIDAVLAPEQLSIKTERRHTEDAHGDCGFGGLDQALFDVGGARSGQQPWTVQP